MQFSKKQGGRYALNFFRNIICRIIKLIFLGDNPIDETSVNWIELWIIEQRISDVLEAILKDIIQQE